jgi:hypothetical protein
MHHQPTRSISEGQPSAPKLLKRTVPGVRKLSALAEPSFSTNRPTPPLNTSARACDEF